MSINFIPQEAKNKDTATVLTFPKSLFTDQRDLQANDYLRNCIWMSKDLADRNKEHFRQALTGTVVYKKTEEGIMVATVSDNDSGVHSTNFGGPIQDIDGFHATHISNLSEDKFWFDEVVRISTSRQLFESLNLTFDQLPEDAEVMKVMHVRQAYLEYVSKIIFTVRNITTDVNSRLIKYSMYDVNTIVEGEEQWKPAGEIEVGSTIRHDEEDYEVLNTTEDDSGTYQVTFTSLIEVDEVAEADITSDTSKFIGWVALDKLVELSQLSLLDSFSTTTLLIIQDKIDNKTI